MITKVKNPTTRPATLRVDVNDATGETVDVPKQKTVTIRTPIPSDTSEVGVRYTGHKELIILETLFK